MGIKCDKNAPRFQLDELCFPSDMRNFIIIKDFNNAKFFCNRIFPPELLKILVHDYPGYAFPVQLSRELAKRGHTVMHAFASQLQCPRGELEKRADDPDSLTLQTVPMHPDYAKNKYSFVKRRRYEIEYGNAAAKLVREWKPEVVLSGQTPTEPQEPILAASQEVEARFHLWLQGFL